MAVTTSSSATIRGISYTRGSSFTCASSQSGNGGSEGDSSSAAALSAGTTYYFYAKASGDYVTYPYAVSNSSGGSIRGWYKEAVFPYATYSVKFNANGGSGAPSTQTKTWGTNLTLSSTKPTRTGYTFKGWGTSASTTTVAYASGATYSSNAAITLYAIWTANTYTISFNANGGTGAPSSVTKTYGVTLTLPTTKPTRTNYEFKGWGTSSKASTATYSAGGSYTGNANATLYAVWELKYELPTITNLKAIRCDSSGTADDMGTYAKVTFSWSCCQLLGTNNISSITVGGTSVSASGTSGSVSVVIGGSLSIETLHSITVVVVDTLKSDGSGTTTKTTSIPDASFPIDFLSGGKGVAFGKVADTKNMIETPWRVRSNYTDVAFTHEHGTTGNIASVGVGSGGTNRGVWVKNASADSGAWLSYTNGTNDTVYNGFNPDGNLRGLMRLNSSNNLHLGYGSYDNTEGSVYYSGNNVYIRSNYSVKITSPSAGLTNSAYGVNKVLATANMYMTSSHSITLSEAVSAQPHGIVLTWSYYSSGSQNYNWIYHFVSKSHVANYSTTGVSFYGFNVDGHMMKYLYISDTTIKGYGDNSTKTVGGVTFTNASYILRQVIGV